jgi:hypothetical protein
MTTIKRKEAETKVDKAIDMTFPASDPIATGGATSTEPSKRPTDRKPPIVSREEIEWARRGGGHTRNSGRLPMISPPIKICPALPSPSGPDISPCP